MRITLGEYIFDNIENFTAYLETTYEQDKLISGEVNLSLGCDALTQEDFNQLVDFLLKPERTKRYKFEITPPKYQVSFDNAYLINKRQKFSFEFQQQVTELSNSAILVHPHATRIRKAKKNWVEGIKSPSMGLQLQYQMPTQHEAPHQQIKATQRKRKNNEQPYQHPEQGTPLTQIPEYVEENARNIVGSYRQFRLLKKDSKSREVYREEFKNLWSENTSAEQRQAAFILFLSVATEDNPPKLKRIISLLQAIPLGDLNYQGLAQVLIHTGADGVLLLLQQMKVLHDKEFFKDFDKLFLDKPENYLALMSRQGLANLQKLSELSNEQKIWWVKLVSQHKATGARPEFNDLFEAYDYFLKELENKSLKLPFSCTLEHIGLMKPTLDRLLFIINNSSDPEEQLTYLDRLDLDGAYHASRYNNYKLVSRQMNLRPNADEEVPDYSTPETPKDVSVWLSRFDLPYEEVVTRFYRFIGVQEWAFSLDVYQKIEREISNNKNLSVQNKVLLLSIAALTTTGQQACTKSKDPYTRFKSLLDKFTAIANHFNEDMSAQLLTVLTVVLGELGNYSWELMPAADELNRLIDILSLTLKTEEPLLEQAQHDFHEASVLALKLMKKYGDAASSVINNYERRLGIEQTHTAAIQKFSFSALLEHLAAPSKLDTFLSGLFHDQPERLSQFVVLLSLLSDDVPKMTRDGEDDSEFEAKIKTLAKALHAMQAEHRSQLLAILTDINIEVSYRLPSLEQLIKVVNSVTEAEEKLNRLPHVEHQNADVLAIVRSELPEVKIGDDAVSEQVINLFSMMEQIYEDWQLQSKFEAFPEKLTGYLESWIGSHQIVLWYLRQRPINARRVFEVLADEEQEAKNVLNSRWFFWTLSGFPEERKQMDEVLGNEFFTQKSFVAVLRSRIETACQFSLRAAINALQTSNRDFDRFLLKQIKELDTDLPIDEALLKLEQQLNAVNELINSLIRIKNQNNVEFHRSISLLTDLIKSTVLGTNSETVVQMRNLLDVLSQGKTSSVASSLAILCKILKGTPDYSSEQLQKALNEVTYLTKYREILGEEAYEVLLRCSFSHNLTQKTLFPLKSMMELKPLVGVDDQHAEDLFDALINGIKKAGSNLDEKLLKKVINKTLSIIQSKAEVGSLVPLLTLLVKACTKCDKDELNRYYNLVCTLESTADSDLNNWAKILIVLGDHATDANIHRLLDVQAGLELNPLNLPELAQLFDYPPYPEMESFINVLNGDVKDLKAYVDEFDRDPKSGRAPQKNAFGIILKDSEQVLDEQFDASNVAQVIADIRNIVEGTALTRQEQYDLAQQIIYINAIGRDKPFTLAVGNDPTTYQIKTYQDLTKVSRAELRELSDTLISKIRTAHLDAHEKLKAQLRLLAVLREQYSRATGKFVDTTQLIAILMALKNQRSNMLVELDEESNCSANALLAVMQWVEADGGAIDVCAVNRDMMVQNYKHDEDFFASLGIASSCVEGNSLKGTYQVGGINYSTIGDMASYRYRARIENEDMTGYKNGHPVASNLILYGSDFSELDEKTLFNLALKREGDDEDSSYTWVYPLINEFINQRQFKILDKGWSEDRDIIQLKEFLDRHAPTGRHKVQLNSLPDKKFSLWINAAIEAQRFVAGEDFIIPPSKTARHVAIPLNQKVAQGDLTFMTHQFLHARLQKKYPDWEFVIEPEMCCIDSVSTKDFIDHYKKQGRVISISNTLSRKERLVEQCNKFDMDIACKIPSYQKNKRVELTTRVIANKAAYVRAVREAINQAQEGQPVVLFAKDVNEVKVLQEYLKKQFSKSNIAAFTGTESVAERKKWINNQSGKKNTITITTTAFAQSADFTTQHPKGFLAIQTYLDARAAQRVTGCTGGKGRPAKYVAIYESKGAYILQSGFYQTQSRRKEILAFLAELQSQQKEEAAVTRHYVQRVSNIQQVVFEQFQEWKEFLHLVCPKHEWKTLDAALSIQREDLTRSLSECSDECFEYTDPQKYPDPYIRRIANKNLQTIALDKAIAAYEVAVCSIWEQHRALLKEKAEYFVVEGSVNALRCHYLDEVSLNEQLKFNRLAARRSKKEKLAEKKKTCRYVESGLEVNGAMLRFADGDVESYREAFAKSQVRLFAKDISLIIENNPHLKKIVRSILVQQVMDAKNLDNLVDLLLDYANKDLPEDRFAEKYTMQPVIQELLRVYKEAGLEETSGINELKAVYFDRVIAELVDELETSLSWAKEEHRGLGYLLERTAVTNAARDILNAAYVLADADKLKGADRLPAQQSAIRNLYRVLAEHEAQLEGLWIFSLGHKNTRTLIKETMATLDGLTAIGSNKDKLDADFIHDCKEESLCTATKRKLNSAIQAMEEKEVDLQKNREWKAIKNTLNAIRAESNSIYAFREMYEVLSHKMEELAGKNSKLQGPVARLRGEVRLLCESLGQEHKELLNTSKYLKCKAENLKEKLNGLNGFKVRDVTLKEGNNGYSQYFDLVIEGTGSHSLLQHFTHYNSCTQNLMNQRSALNESLKQAKEKMDTLDQLIKEEVPLLKLEENKKANAAKFPEQFQEQVNEILGLKELIDAQAPEHLDSFPESVRKHFHDRELMKSFDFPNLETEEIEKIQDIILKIDFRDLQERIIEGTKPKNLWGNISSYMSSYVFTPENMEDWRLEFNDLIKRPTRNLNKAFRPDIQKKQNILAGQLELLRQQIAEQAESLQQQVAFLNEKIDEEEQKEGIYAMRITSIAELSKFEKELMRVKSQQKANPSLDETLKSDRPSRVSIDIHETDIESVALVM
ncbi:hypothetical protein [Fluoribacter gormanii]|uniref:Protein translocase subunit SecA n=1 Tax=Fluoribacter gormanii TaxID=464 RepID=A0A377GGU6_9GAMM|nr:hypothetical protein [Fluoribacter gormanii]KTD02243.1 LigA, interaptin [Fluoribacter gormanii]SIR26162.1 hypothetical protein SAMN05421777_10929 [Fluoribacter gormanii]STO24049.1 Uncharacterised protein [Fluoribacter gormanii]